MGPYTIAFISSRNEISILISVLLIQRYHVITNYEDLSVMKIGVLRN